MTSGVDKKCLRVIPIALVLNFGVIPIIGCVIASRWTTGEPALFVGMMLYFVAPCTNWFLGFTRLAGGNVALGAVLLPLNLVLQLALYPLYLSLFARQSGSVGVSVSLLTLAHWLLLPLGIAVVARLWISALSPRTAAFATAVVLRSTPAVIAVLILQVFAGNVGVIGSHVVIFAKILLAVFLFFCATFVLCKIVARMFRLRYREKALLAMTTTARNAPLMLALTTVALPHQPLVSAAIVIGMMIEFPHLSLVRFLLLRRRPKALNLR